MGRQLFIFAMVRGALFAVHAERTQKIDEPRAKREGNPQNVYHARTKKKYFAKKAIKKAPYLVDKWRIVVKIIILRPITCIMLNLT